MQHAIDVLRKQLKIVTKVSADGTMQFFKSLDIKPGQEKLYIEFALQVLENLTVEDGFLVAHYSGKILEEYDDGSSVERVKKLRPNLPPLSGLRDYRSDFDVLIHVLEGKKKGVCMCQTKLAGNTSPYESIFKIIDSKVYQEQYIKVYSVQCTLCNKTYSVTEDPSYHYPIYSWSSI